MKRIFNPILMCLALVACNKAMDSRSADSVLDLNGSQVVFRLKSIATRATGVTEVTTSFLTSFNVVAVSGGNTQTLVWDDGVFTGSPQGNFTGGKFWPSESVSWSFYASNAPMTFAGSGTIIDVSNCDTDIVAEYLEGATYKAANGLTFDHILAQIGTVAMKAPEGYLVSDLKVSLEPIYSGTFSMRNNSWNRGVKGSRVYLIGSANAGVSIPEVGGGYVSGDNDLWLVPGSYQLTAEYSLAKGDFFKSGYEKHATVDIRQGKNNNLGLPDTDGDGLFDDPNIPDAGNDIADIIFTVEVTPWDNEDIPTNFQ